MRAKASLLFVFAIAFVAFALPGFLGRQMVDTPMMEPSTTGTPISEETTLPIPSPGTTLACLKEALAVTIEDSWGGLGVPYRAYYQLQRQNVGQASFQAGWVVPTPVTADISIPREVAVEFLAILARSPAVYGTYEPSIFHTDSYPSLSVDIRLSDQRGQFYSRSRGTTRIPWGLDIQGNTYVINSDEPAIALELLKPYLKRDVLQEVIGKQYLGMPETGKHDDSQP